MRISGIQSYVVRPKSLQVQSQNKPSFGELSPDAEDMIDRTFRNKNKGSELYNAWVDKAIALFKSKEADWCLIDTNGRNHIGISVVDEHKARVGETFSGRLALTMEGRKYDANGLSGLIQCVETVNSEMKKVAQIDATKGKK